MVIVALGEVIAGVVQLEVLSRAIAPDDSTPSRDDDRSSDGALDCVTESLPSRSLLIFAADSISRTLSG